MTAYLFRLEIDDERGLPGADSDMAALLRCAILDQAEKAGDLEILDLCKPAATEGLIIALEGGNITSVACHDPALVGMPFWTIDYDIEGADFSEGNVRDVLQDDGTRSLAYVFANAVEAATVEHPAASPVVLTDEIEEG